MLKKLATLFNRKSFSRNFPLPFLELVSSWEKIVGERLAQNTMPWKNIRGTLVIITTHPAYAQQLSFMEEELKQKIFKACPKLVAKIKKLSFQANSTYFEGKKNNIAREERAEKKVLYNKHDPHYKKLLREAEDYFADIETPELKAQFISLYLQSADAKDDRFL